MSAKVEKPPKPVRFAGVFPAVSNHHIDKTKNSTSQYRKSNSCCDGKSTVNDQALFAL
jgi:hypothetical protein